MPTILLTRPLARSELLAEELQRMGYQTLIEPVIAIVPTRAPQPDGSFQAVMITSANALWTLERNGEKLSGLLKLPCFCVGPRTAERAKAFGFTDVHYTAGDGAALAHLITQKLADKIKPILHLAGREIDSKAQHALHARDLNVAVWPLYDAVASEHLSDRAINALRRNELDAVLVFSARTAEILSSLLLRHRIEACCAGLTAIGLSETITSVLKPLHWRKLIAAKVPSEEAVLKALTQIHPVS